MNSLPVLSPAPSTEVSIAIGGRAVSMPAGLAVSDRKNKDGRTLGVRLAFTGPKSASDLKAEGKKLGLKGNALKRHVDSCLRGDNATAAWVRHDAITSAMRSAGFVPEVADSNKKGDQFKVTYRRPEVSEEQLVQEAAAKALEASVAKLVARMGVTEEEAREILAGE